MASQRVSFNILDALLTRKRTSQSGRSNMAIRRGMLIKNVAERPLTIRLRTRVIKMKAEEELLVTAEEVRDSILRENLQIRTIAIVRPSTEEENDALAQELAGKS